jgi:3',5'-cyclic AMP phosphodiesterase CpdA
MRKVVHLSDLHFGRTRPELLDPMVDAVNGLGPDIVAISGDFTQRARNWQFREARAFIDRIEARCLCVPGNHDVPLDNPVLRFLAPWRRYRRWIDEELEPVHVDDEIAVVGINTADPKAWQRGVVRPRSMQRVCGRLSAAEAACMQIVVAHHPFEQLPGEKKELMPGAAEAVARLSTCGAQIVLSGHLHSWRAAPFTLPKGHAGILQIQAGTGLSTRLRGEANDFNLLTIESDAVTVERFVAEDGESSFERTSALVFRREGDGWADGVTQEPETVEA